MGLIVADPAAPGPFVPPAEATGASPVWEDDFESGTFNFASAETQNAGWRDEAWADGTNGEDIAVNQENPRTGSFSMMIRFPDHGDLNVDGLWPDGTGGMNRKAKWQVDNVSEVWKEFYVYVPNNYKHAEVVNGADNRKFWAVWDDERQDEDVSVFNELLDGGDSQTPARTSKGRVFMDTDREVAGASGSWFSDGSGNGCGVSPCAGDMLKLADRGTWVRLRYHVKLSSARGVNDGQFHIWKNDDLIMQDEALDLYPSATGNFFLQDGQLMGAQNSAYDVETKFYFDDFSIWYDDPGWL